MTANPEHGFNNLAYSATSAAISSTDTQIPLVASGAATFLDGWLSDRNLYLTLTNVSGDIEVVKVTGIYHDILTVERGQDGTTAQAWGAGAIVCQRGAATDYASFLQRGAFRTFAGNPNGVLAGLFPGEKLYDSDSMGWWINISGTEWECITGSCIPLWVSYFDDTYWAAQSNGIWNGSAWQETGAGMVLVPIGTWTDDFYPAEMRVTCSTDSGEVRLWNVADASHLLCDSTPYISQTPLVLDWSYDPLTPISRIDLWLTTLVTNIEFKLTI